MHRFDVLLEIRRAGEAVVARLADKLFVVVLMNFLDMRIQIRLRGEYFSA